jgi:ssDNA thymidine ADP-ribosyltransferase DarT-like protein
MGAISAELDAEGVNLLFHFTHVANLPSILGLGGLCSKGELERRHAWPCARPGGGEVSHLLDRRVGNWDLVPMNLTANTPMLYQKRCQEDAYAVVAVNTIVADRDGVVFTNRNAVAGDQRRLSGMDGLELIDFGVITGQPRPWDREGWVIPVQAEILAPRFVELVTFHGIVFPTDALLASTRTQGGDPLEEIDCVVFPELFPEILQA